MARTCSEICIDADSHKDDLNYLADLDKEVRLNKKEYPLVELRFMLECLENLVIEMARKDADTIKDLLKPLFKPL